MQPPIGADGFTLKRGGLLKHKTDPAGNSQLILEPADIQNLFKSGKNIQYNTSDGSIHVSSISSFDNVIITGEPSSNEKHAATVKYVNEKIQGLDIKESVKVASTENINLASVVSSMDNEVLQNGNRILLKNQTDSKENGIYTVNASGILERAADFAIGADVGGAFVFVEKGNHGAKGFVQTTSHAIVGTDNITFTQFNGAYAFNAGDGLTQEGNTLNVDNSLNFVTEMTGLATIGTDGSTLAIKSIIGGPTIVRIDASLNDLNTTIINLGSSSSTNNGHWQTLSQELEDLSGVVVDLSSELSTEVSTARSAESVLSTDISTVSTGLSTEVSTARSAEVVLSSELSSETSRINVVYNTPDIVGINDAPSYVGQVTVASDKVYIATGTDNASDWKEMAFA